MKKILLFCLILFIGSSSMETGAWAIDVDWMQTGVRVWYLGGVGSGMTSNAEEAYLFDAVVGDNVQVTRHSALDHWNSPNAPETASYSFSGMGPCWIHPQALQTVDMGDYWMGHEITMVVRSDYTIDMLPYQFLPANALFKLQPQREVVKLVYMIAGFSTGSAYFDADTGLLLLYSTSNGLVTVFFVLSEINYNFADKTAFAEDDGPHTGYKSLVSEQSMNFSGIGGGSVVIQSLVESRYGDTVEMRVLGSDAKDTLKQWDENHCFFGAVPVLRRMDATEAPNYPPELWNEFGEYLWWWVPQDALQKISINIFDVDMSRTNTSPYTFSATEQPEGLFFSNIIFGDDGYLIEFSAKDSEIGLDIDPGDDIFQNLTTVYGSGYYRSTMGQATPVQNHFNITPLMNLLLLQ